MTSREVVEQAVKLIPLPSSHERVTGVGSKELLKVFKKLGWESFLLNEGH